MVSTREFLGVHQPKQVPIAARTRFYGKCVREVCASCIRFDALQRLSSVVQRFLCHTELKKHQRHLMQLMKTSLSLLHNLLISCSSYKDSERLRTHLVQNTDFVTEALIPYFWFIANHATQINAQQEEGALGDEPANYTSAQHHVALTLKVLVACTYQIGSFHNLLNNNNITIQLLRIPWLADSAELVELLLRFNVNLRFCEYGKGEDAPAVMERPSHRFAQAIACRDTREGALYVQSLVDGFTVTVGRLSETERLRLQRCLSSPGRDIHLPLCRTSTSFRCLAFAFDELAFTQQLPAFEALRHDNDILSSTRRPLDGMAALLFGQWYQTSVRAATKQAPEEAKLAEEAKEEAKEVTQADEQDEEDESQPLYNRLCARTDEEGRLHPRPLLLRHGEAKESYRPHHLAPLSGHHAPDSLNKKRPLPALRTAARASHAPRDAVPPQFVCALSGNVMQEPVVSPYGDVFDKAAVLAWLAEHQCCPLDASRTLRQQDLAAAPQQLADGLRDFRFRAIMEQQQ